MADSIQIGGFRTTFRADASMTGGAYALIEHTLAPGLLGARPHRHSRDDFHVMGQLVEQHGLRLG